MIDRCLLTVPGSGTRLLWELLYYNGLEYIEPKCIGKKKTDKPPFFFAHTPASPEFREKTETFEAKCVVLLRRDLLASVVSWILNDLNYEKLPADFDFKRIWCVFKNRLAEVSESLDWLKSSKIPYITIFYEDFQSEEGKRATLAKIFDHWGVEPPEEFWHLTPDVMEIKKGYNEDNWLFYNRFLMGIFEGLDVDW